MLVNSRSEESELIQKRPLKEDIFDVLHEKIISGAYKPGDWLRQEDIATQLGVSMTPVREALDLLVSGGGKEDHAGASCSAGKDACGGEKARHPG